MDRDELESLIALISSQQVAIVHLSRIVAELTGTDIKALSDSFRDAAEDYSFEVNNEITSIILTKIANGLETTGTSANDELRNYIYKLF